MITKAGKVMTHKFLSIYTYLPLALAAVFSCTEARADDPDPTPPVAIACPGGTCDNQTINANGEMTVNSEGVANNNTIGNTGKLTVNDGGTANSTTINTGGQAIVNTGGSVFTTTVSGGLLDIAEGGNAEGTKVNSGVVINKGNASNTTVNSAGATIGDTNYKGFEVSGNGVAENTTVNTGGYMLVKEGGNANGTVLEGGTVEVRFDVPTGDSSGTTPPDSDTGSGDGTTPDEGDGTNPDEGGDVTPPEPTQTSSTIENTTINSGTLNIETGGEATTTTVNQNGVMNVNDGGKANSTVVNRGVLNVNDGGYASGTTVDGGTMNLTDSGGADNSTINSNGKIIAKDLSSVRGTVINDGTLTLQDGAMAWNTTVNSGGYVDGTASRGTITGLTVNDLGSYHLTTDNLVIDANLYGKHYDSLFTNGVGTGIIVGGDSQIDVLSNGILDGSVLQHSGLIDVKSGGKITNTTANEYGDIAIASGASASNTTLNDNSSMLVSGTAQNVIVNSGGHSTGLSTRVEGLEANNGAVVNQVTVNNGGTVLIKNGATVNDSSVNGGKFTAEAGANLNNLAARANANLSLASGANLAGNVTVAESASLGGTYNYNQIFSDAAINSLTVTNGINAKFANSLVATSAGKNLTFADGSYQISNSGLNGSTTVSGWDRLNIGGVDGSANVKLAGDLTMASADKEIKINNGSSLDSSEIENINILGSIVNGGDLNLVSAGSLAEDKNNTMTIAGNYTGKSNSNITLKVDTAQNLSDKIVINGDVQGSSNLIVKITSSDKPTEKIMFLEAPNDNLATGSSFNIWRVNTSPYQWDTSHEGSSWYMDMANQGGKIGVYSEVMAYMGLPNAGMEQTRSMVYNVINKVNMRNNNLVDNRVMHSPEYRYYSKGIENYYNNYNFWVMPVYQTITNESSVNYDADIIGGEAGADLYNDSNNKAGVYLSYRQGNYKFDGKADNFFSRYGSEIDIDSYMGGVYYRHNWQDLWLLATVYGGVQQADIKTKDDVKSDTDATEFGATIAGGYVYNINYNFNIEPGAIINFTSISYDDAKDIYGKTAEFDTLTLIEADVGVKFENTWNLDNGYAKAYIRPSILLSSVSGDEVKITNFLDKSPEIDDGAYARLEIGGSADLSKFFSMYTTIRATAGSDYQDLAVSAGLNYVF